MTIRRRFPIFYLLSGMILLVFGFQAVQVSAIKTYKIERRKSVSEDNKLHQSTYPAMINAISDSYGGPEGAK